MSEPKTVWEEMTGEPDPDADDRRMLVSLLRAYHEARADRDNAVKRVDSLGKMMREFLESHPGEVLWDGENKIEARLQERSGGVTYDLIAIAHQDHVLFDRLFNLGILTVDAAAAKAQRDQVAGLEKYAMPKRGTTALIVERKE